MLPPSPHLPTTRSSDMVTAAELLTPIHTPHTASVRPGVGKGIHSAQQVGSCNHMPIVSSPSHHQRSHPAHQLPPPQRHRPTVTPRPARPPPPVREVPSVRPSVPARLGRRRPAHRPTQPHDSNRLTTQTWVELTDGAPKKASHAAYRQGEADRATGRPRLPPKTMAATGGETRRVLVRACRNRDPSAPLGT